MIKMRMGRNVILGMKRLRRKHHGRNTLEAADAFPAICQVGVDRELLPQTVDQQKACLPQPEQRQLTFSYLTCTNFFREAHCLSSLRTVRHF